MEPTPWFIFQLQGWTEKYKKKTSILGSYQYNNGFIHGYLDIAHSLPGCKRWLSFRYTIVEIKPVSLKKKKLNA